MNNFLEDLIQEILLRLPVKSLLRYKSVSKSWLYLISDPLFAKSHFKLASSNAADRLLYLTVYQTLSIDVNASSFHEDSAVAKLNFPLTASFDRFRIMGSCRGLLLLHDTENISVWNPSTGFCKEVAKFPVLPFVYPFKLGFGFDSSTDDYVVVLAYQPNPAFRTCFEFFCLKANSWGKLDGAHSVYLYVSHSGNSGPFLNGSVHWLAHCSDAQVDAIVALDLTQKILTQLPLPFVRSLEDFNFGLLGGGLSLSFADRCYTEIWVMKEYGLKSSWEKSIVVPPGETPARFFVPTCFTKGHEIVGIYNGVGLMKFNHQGEFLEHLTYGRIKYSYKAVMYTESLLALPVTLDIEGGGEDMQQ